MHTDVDINYGVDFERALERLHHAAGKIFRQYREAKHGNAAGKIFRQYREAKHGNADVAQIARLRQDYLDAQREAEGLSPRDASIIGRLRKTCLICRPKSLRWSKSTCECAHDLSNIRLRNLKIAPRTNAILALRTADGAPA